MTRYSIRIASQYLSATQDLSHGMSLSSARAFAKQWTQDLAGSKAMWSVVVYDDTGTSLDRYEVTVAVK